MVFSSWMTLFIHSPLFNDRQIYLDETEVPLWYKLPQCSRNSFSAVTCTQPINTIFLLRTLLICQVFFPSLFYVGVYLFEDLAVTPKGAKLLLGSTMYMISWRNVSTLGCDSSNLFLVSALLPESLKEDV